MKINIGPYRSYFTITSAVRRICTAIGLSEESGDRFLDLIEPITDKPFVNKFESLVNVWVNRPRKISIKIDSYDTWGMDHTLAMIIVPMLKQLKATKQGYALIDDEDVPESIRSSKDPNYQSSSWYQDIFGPERWDWVLSEMIWAFEQMNTDDVRIDFAPADVQARLANGLRLFAKYYRALWD